MLVHSSIDSNSLEFLFKYKGFVVMNICLNTEVASPPSYLTMYT